MNLMQAAIDFIKTLQHHEIMLLHVRDELYAGSWDDMRRELEERRSGIKYIDQSDTAKKIGRDINIIERLVAVEKSIGCNLGDVIRGNKSLTPIMSS